MGAAQSLRSSYTADELRVLISQPLDPTAHVERGELLRLLASGTALTVTARDRIAATLDEVVVATLRRAGSEGERCASELLEGCEFRFSTGRAQHGGAIAARASECTDDIITLLNAFTPENEAGDHGALIAARAPSVGDRVYALRASYTCIHTDGRTDMRASARAYTQTFVHAHARYFWPAWVTRVSAAAVDIEFLVVAGAGESKQAAVSMVEEVRPKESSEIRVRAHDFGLTISFRA